MVSLRLTESDDWGYRSRTIDNIKGADITVAIAADFTTAGERLTQREAEYLSKYIGIGVRFTAEHIASTIKASIFKQRERTNNQSKDVTINFAGNGIQTFARHGYTQEALNKLVFDVIQSLRGWYQVTAIRSGGQTGLDHAALVAGLALGIPVHGHYPTGYRRRDVDGIDNNSTEEQIRLEIIQDAAVLNPELLNPMSAMLLGVMNDPTASCGCFK